MRLLFSLLPQANRICISYKDNTSMIGNLQLFSSVSLWTLQKYFWFWLGRQIMDFPHLYQWVPAGIGYIWSCILYWLYIVYIYWIYNWSTPDCVRWTKRLMWSSSFHYQILQKRRKEVIFSVEQDFVVTHPKPAPVQIYDYYFTGRSLF